MMYRVGQLGADRPVTLVARPDQRLSASLSPLTPTDSEDAVPRQANRAGPAGPR